MMLEVEVQQRQRIHSLPLLLHDKIDHISTS